MKRSEKVSRLVSQTYSAINDLSAADKKQMGTARVVALAWIQRAAIKFFEQPQQPAKR